MIPPPIIPQRQLCYNGILLLGATMVKPFKDYHPPECFVKFETLRPGDTFHDIIDSKTVQFVKLLRRPSSPFNAVKLDTGEQVNLDEDEFVHPVNVGWVAEIECYGIKIPPEIKGKDHKHIVAYLFSQTEARKENDAWRAELTKYVPSLGHMSFCGPARTVRWVMEYLGHEVKQ